MHQYTHIQTYCILHNRHTCIQTFMTVTQIRHKHTCTRAYDYIVTDHKGSHPSISPRGRKRQGGGNGSQPL